MYLINKYDIKLPKMYIVCSIIRVLSTIMPQSGYLHPDEYFQSTEVLLGNIFGVKSSTVWEFDRKFPVRNIFIPYIVYAIPLIILKHLMLLGYNVGTTPYLFVILPRLMACCFSFLVDFSLYKICQICGKDPGNYMVLLSSSYIMWLYGTRTFSNTIEMILFSVLLYVVSNCMTVAKEVTGTHNKLEQEIDAAVTVNEKIRLSLALKRLPNPTFQNCTLIAAILILGIYNRPTFIAFALSPVFFWFRRSIKHPVNLWTFNYRIWFLILASIPFVILLTVVDSIYYGYTTFEELLNMNAIVDKSYVVTPYNFFKYNSNNENLSKHGLHPWYLHILVNVPLLFNVLGVCQIMSIIFHVYRLLTLRRNELPKLENIQTMLFVSFVVPLFLLSFIPHQEPRFLIPLILPIILLHTETIYSSKTPSTNTFCGNYKQWLCSMWWVCNLLSFIFYSFFHQAGIYRLVTDLSEEYRNDSSRDPICVITSHTYSVPKSLIYAPAFGRNKTNTADQKYIFIYTMGSSHSFDIVPTIVKSVDGVCKSKSRNSKYKIYFIIPTILTGSFYEMMIKYNMSYVTNRVYYPHISTEVFNRIYKNYTPNKIFNTRYDSSSDVSEQSVLDYIGLSLIQIDF